MLTAQQASIMPIINRAHKCEGLFHGSESQNGAIWMQFIFNTQSALNRFDHRLRIDGYGKLCKLGDMPLSIKVMI